MDFEFIRKTLFILYLVMSTKADGRGSESICKGSEFPKVFFSHYFTSQASFNAIVSANFMDVGTKITITYDSEVNIDYNETAVRLAKSDTVNNIYTFELKLRVDNTGKQIGYEQIAASGQQYPHHPPYITSLKINDEEKCFQPDMEVYSRNNIFPKYFTSAPNKFCGRRKILTHNVKKPLIVSGSQTLPGLWPWHAALFEVKLNRGTTAYTGGGTLISKHLVLTAGHCVTKNGQPLNPEVLKIHLGKYNLFGEDIADQSIEVFDVIVHSDFSHRNLDNDIALLKLRTAAIFNNYVQPACLWFDDIYDHIGSYEVTGTVAGWGFDRTDTLSSTLHTATMPQVPDTTCIIYQPIFYSKILNGKKFCAGHGNGTTPCNGDSGGGYVVFVSDISKGNSEFSSKEAGLTGAWYVKGIVSLTLAREDAALCDPNGYTVFTDISKHREWILSHMNGH